MTQYLIIGAIVLWAVLYSGWSLTPAVSRRAAAARISAWAHRAGLVSKQRAKRLEARLARTGGCSACAECKGCAGARPGSPPRGPSL